MTFNGAQFRYMRAVLFSLCLVFGVSYSCLAVGPKISAGWYHTIALKYDGTVWAWGNNGNGELGNGANTSSNVRVQVSQATGLSDVTSISGGKLHSAALMSDGTVWTWGDNSNGQLGIGESNSSRNSPVQVSGLIGVTAISSGKVHTVALRSDGTLWSWGENYSGLLGNGTTTPSHSPVQATGFTGTVTAVASGGWFTLAMYSDGTVWAVGNNLYGSLGNGTTTSSVTPVQVSGLSDSGTVTAIACGDLHSIALKSDGTVWAWGYNAHGQLGNGESGTATSRSAPVQVSSLTNVTAIACGLEQSIAMKDDGTVWAWGNNEYRLLGNNSTVEYSAVPVLVSGLNDVTAIAGGRWHTVALKSDGTVQSWGWNQYGQLGNESNTTSYTPVQASDINLNETSTTTSTTTTTTTTSTTTTTQSGGGGGGGGGGGTTTPTPGVTPTPETTPTPDITPAPGITPLPTVPPLPTPPPVPLPSPTVTLIATPTPSGECEPDSIGLSSKKKIRLKVKKSAKVTVTLTGVDGCLVEGEEVTAEINKAGKKRISISESELTDENGEATFTIKAKKRHGKAKIIFEAGGLAKQLRVEVRKSRK